MSEFEPRGEMIEIEGVVSKLSWRNPHIMLELTITNENGAEETWTLEAGAVSGQRRKGLTGDEISVGDSVRIAGFPSYRRDNFMKGMHLLLLEDNLELLISATRNPRWSTNTLGSDRNVFDPERVSTASGNGIYRIWSQGRQNAWYFAGRRLATYELTETAAAAAAEWDDITDNPVMECIGPGMPSLMGNPYPMEFTRVGANIEIRFEEFDMLRVIHMGENVADPETVPPSKLGYSVGRWEGDTLIVDTSRINWHYFDRSGAPQTPNVTVNERFTVEEDGNRMETVMTIDDPATLVEPFVVNLGYVWKPGDALNPYECELEDWQSIENTLTNFTGPENNDFRKRKKRLADPLDISGTRRQIQSTRAFHSTGVHHFRPQTVQQTRTTSYSARQQFTS